MPKIDDYWKQITTSDRWYDLNDDQKDQMREKLFDRIVRHSSSYGGLAESERESVRQRFDEATKIEPEGMMHSLERKGKNIVKAVKPVIEKGKEISNAIPGAVQKGVLGAEAGLEKVEGAIGKNTLVRKAETGMSVAEEVSKKIEPAPMKAGYAAAGALSKGISKVGDVVGNAIEPNYEKPVLSDFDVARAIASGSVKTVSQFVAGMIPTSFPQTAMYAALDAVHRFGGSTYLTRDAKTPISTMKTGLSEKATGLGDEFEKIVTKRRIENNSRQMRDGPPKPLEVLAHKEQVLKTQDELQQYEEWLKQADETSTRGGEPPGDLHPEAKVNISQLRDMAKERLQKLQDEPIRVQSLSYAEDPLRDYFTKRLELYPKPGQAIELPAGAPRETISMLPEGPKPPELLKTGEPPTQKSPLEGPAPKAPPAITGPATPPTASFGEGIKAYKDYLTAAFKERLPGHTKQAIDKLAGTLFSALKDKQFIHPTRPKPINQEMMNLLDKLVDGSIRPEEPPIEPSTGIVKPPKPPRPKGPSMASENARLLEKGLDPAEVRAVAEGLQYRHNALQGISDYENHIQANGGISMNPEDATGRIPEKEEYIRNVPIHLRGRTFPDQMAQSLFEAGLQEDASSSTMYRKLSERKAAGEKRSVSSFLDEAEYRLEHEKMQESGFEPPTQVLIPDMPSAAMPDKGIEKTQGQVPPDKLMEDFRNQDETQRSMFDIASDINKHLGEKGQLGGEIDPVRQAALEAAVKELVDRAMALGYQTSQDIMFYAAKNAPSELRDALRNNLHPTLSPFDSHAYKEVDAAKSGSAIAKKSLMDRAMRDYLKEKAQWSKDKVRSFKASKQILSFKDADEAQMRLKNELFLFDTYRNHSKVELAAQRWYNEGGAPKVESVMRQGWAEEDAKEAVRLAREPSDRMKAAKPSTQFHEDSWHDLFSEHYDDLGYVSNHVTRRWKQPQQYINWEGTVLQGRPNFFKGRKLITQAQGLDAGLDPVSLDIRDDLKASNELRVTTLSRIHALTKIATTMDRMGHGSIIDEAPEGAITQGRKAHITPHTGKAPLDWLRYKDVSLLRDLAINPEYKPAMDYMLSQRFKGWGAEWMDYLAGTSKSARLSLSGFHPASLTEMLLTGSSYRDVFSFNMNRNTLFKSARYIAKGATAALEDPLTWKNPLTKEGRIHNAAEVSRLYDSYMKGSALLANRALALDMAEGGFKFGGMEEDVANHISKTISRYEEHLKNRIANPGSPEEAKYYGKALREALGTATGVREANDVFQKGLWGYIHQSFAMSLYEGQLADNIKKFNIDAPEGKKIPVEKIKSDTANFVHKEVGGISYGRLLITPRMQQILQWALLAPSWTIGRALMGAAVFEKGPEGRQARKQALRMALAYGITGNMINYARTKAAFGKGRWLHENPEGQKLNVFWKLNEKKEELYVQGSKASTEVFDDIDHPMKTLAGKASPPVQAAAKIFDWSKAPSGTPYVENPFQAGVGMFMPGSISGMSAYDMLPVRKGVSSASVARLFDQYYKTGNEKYRNDAIRFAEEAGINWESINRYSKGRSTSHRHKEDRAAYLQ